MTRLCCSDSTCERPGMRQRDGQWWCMWHPESQPPALDPKTGRPITATPIRVARPKVEKQPTPRVAARRVAPAARPVREPKPRKPPVIRGGPCATEGCPRPGGHSGRHSQPKAPRTYTPRPAVDEHLAAARYAEGARLFDLSAELGIGVKRLRTILNQQGIPIRRRGEVIDATSRNRGKPLDTAALELLYAAGNDIRQVALHLGVKTSRVAEHLRTAGLLRPPANARREGYTDIRIRLEPGLYDAIQQHLPSTGHQYVTHYIRELILADINAGRPEHEQVA